MTVLDPRIGYSGLKDDYFDDEELLDGLHKSKAALETHFNHSYAGQHSAPSITHAPHASNTTSMSRGSQTHDFTARFRKRPQTLQNEVEEFFNLPPQDFQSCNPIQWWQSNRSRFPNLYCLARDILAIPGRLKLMFKLPLLLSAKFRSVSGSAVAVERIFSGGRDTISLRRASLKPDTIRFLMLVKQHIRMRRL